MKWILHLTVVHRKKQPTDIFATLMWHLKTPQRRHPVQSMRPHQRSMRPPQRTVRPHLRTPERLVQRVRKQRLRRAEKAFVDWTSMRPLWHSMTPTQSNSLPRLSRVLTKSLPNSTATFHGMVIACISQTARTNSFATQPVPE